MIWLSWRTLRFRWPVFIGTFLALTFGVSLMATALLCIAGTQSTSVAEDWLVSVATTLLGNAAGVSGAAAIFVVAGTFAFAVTQRRREFALLRAIGATPRQVRRLVMGESLLVGIAASVTGCLLGVVIAPYFARWMASVELAPTNFAPQVTWWPLAIAGAVGLVSALVSAWMAARRAAKVSPIDALTEASVEKHTMTPLRWIAAAVFLLGAGLLVPVVLGTTSGIAAAYILLEILLLLFGIAMLIPVFTLVLVRLTSWLIPGTVGGLAKANIITGLRRSSSTAAPIFITMGLAAAAFSSIATMAEAHNHAVKERLTAPFAIVANEGGLSNATLADLQQAVKNAAVEPVTPSSAVRVKDSDRNSDRLPVLYVNPTIAQVMNMPLLEGNLTDLTGDTTVAVSNRLATINKWKVGDKPTIWLANGTEVSPTVVAIVKDSPDLGNVILLPDALRQSAVPDLAVPVAYVAPPAGTTPSQLQALLEPVARSRDAQLIAANTFLATEQEKDARIDQVALLTVIGLAVLYTAISIANTCIMATTGRFHDFAILQLSGATRKQILGMVILEMCLINFVAAVAAAIVTAVSLGITFASNANPQIVIPWGQVIPVILTCLGIALATSIISTLWVFRTPAIRIATARE